MSFVGIHARLGGVLAAPAIALAVLCAACGDDNGSGERDGSTAERDGSAPGDLDAAVLFACAREENGVECGDGQHCIDGMCVYNTCGDGVKAGGEQCDDGNEAPLDGCDPGCGVELEGCGNGRIEQDEECDDGNTIDDDACSNACVLNECGNMRVDAGEECDDGNTIDDDECSNGCLRVRCRNGRVDPGEECDDGDREDDNGCTNRCRIQICGNGIQEVDEQCDDGNTDNEDDCSNACTSNACGNGVVDPGEECDSTPSCTAECTMGEDLCTPCEMEHCSDYMMLGAYDLVKACYEGMPNPEYAPDPGPAEEFAADCRGAVDCSRRSRCLEGLGPGETPDGRPLCYCGSASVDECAMNGPAGDAACLEEWLAAGRAADNNQMQLRLADFAFPSGWATYLLACDYELCREECLGL